MMRLPFLDIKLTKEKGRGVFTTENISKGTIIELSPVIIIEPRHRKHIDKTLLSHYVFEWGWKKDHYCMALGYVPIYNHSYSSNCEYEMDYDSNTIQIKAVKKIKVGEELTINYNGSPNDATPIWFDAK